MKYFFNAIVLAFLFASCSPKLQYAINTPLTITKFESRSKLFTGYIPTGWFTSTDTLHGASLEAWLMKNDFSAALAFRELNLDQKSNVIVMKEGLEFLAEMSQSFSLTDTSVIVVPVKTFKLGENQYCSYELRSGSLMKRYVIFTASNHYYECEATTLKGEWNQTSIAELFTLQQSILASLQRKSLLP